MSRLFGRSWKVTVGDLEVSALDLQCTIKKSLKAEPNTCELTLYNLSEASLAKLSTPKKLPIEVRGGYGDDLSVLYLGEIRNAQTTIEGPDSVSVLTTGDSEDAIRKGRINIPVGKGMTVQDVMRLLAESLGVAPGNLQATIAKLSSKALSNIYGDGTILSGNAARELSTLCRAAGLEWSIQNGKLQFLDRGKPTDDKAIELSSDTGLIGSPSVDNKGILQATCLLIPDLVPGRKVAMNAAYVKGGYRITHVEYTMDTAGEDWFAKIHGAKY